MSGVVLDIVRGPDAGRKFPTDVGHYRVLGRAYGVLGGTAIVSSGERRRLDVEDQQRMSEHLKDRGAGGKVGARASVDNFERKDDLDLERHLRQRPARDRVGARPGRPAPHRRDAHRDPLHLSSGIAPALVRVAETTDGSSSARSPPAC